MRLQFIPSLETLSYKLDKFGCINRLMRILTLFYQDPEKPGDKPKMQTYEVDLNT